MLASQYDGAESLVKVVVMAGAELNVESYW